MEQRPPPTAVQSHQPPPHPPPPASIIQDKIPDRRRYERQEHIKEEEADSHPGVNVELISQVKKMFLLNESSPV